MRSSISAGLASDFQFIQLQGGAGRDQRVTGVVRVFVPPVLPLPCLGLTNAAVLYLRPWPPSGHKVPLNTLPLTLQT